MGQTGAQRWCMNVSRCVLLSHMLNFSGDHNAIATIIHTAGQLQSCFAADDYFAELRLLVLTMLC